MKILIGCERSGVVRDEFRKLGHDAWSCDLAPSYPGPFEQYHFQCDIREVIYDYWDMLIAHPPCTDMSVSGALWFDHPNFPNKRADQKKALEFFVFLDTFTAIEKRCMENPVSVVATQHRKPDQYIEPFYFGHAETKKTGLWLNGLPKLKKKYYVLDSPDVDPHRIHKMARTENRGELRSITYKGIAMAMAEQWGELK